MVPLKIVSNVSRFKPALNLNRVLADLNRGSNSLNSISVLSSIPWMPILWEDDCSPVPARYYVLYKMIFYTTKFQQLLKGVFAKNERGYRLNAIKKRFWSLLILLLSVASIRRNLLKILKIHDFFVLISRNFVLFFYLQFTQWEHNHNWNRWWALKAYL